MSRVVGFSLQFKGSNDTLSEIERVEKSLKSVADQINAINKQNGGVVKPLTAGQGDFKKALNETNQILDQQTKLLKELAKAKPVDKTVIDGLNEKLKGFKKEIQDLKKELEAIKSPKIKIEKPEGFENAKGAITNILKELQGFSPAFDKVAEGAGLKFQNRISEIDKKIKLVKDGITSARGSGASDDQINELIKAERLLKAEKGELTKQINAEAKAFTDLSKTIDPTSLVGMRFELVKLKNEYSLLSEAQRSAQKGQELFNKIVNTNINISNLEQAQGDFRRNVGNYQNAITSIIPILDELKNKGKLTGASLVEAFKAESFANVERLQKEVTDLANDYDRLNKEQREMAEGQAIFAKLTSKAHELEGAMRSLPKHTEQFKRNFLGIADIVTGGIIGGGVVASFQAAFNGIRNTIDISAELSDLEADVRKTTGLTISEVKNLERAFKSIDTRTSTKDLLDIAASAGQLGIEGVQGVEKFTKAINLVSVALKDDLGGDTNKISNDLAKLSNILFGATTDGELLADNISHIGNALNVLSSTSSATGEKIVDFATRIGGTLKPLGVSAEKILALSATFDELNILPEKGATAINNLIKDIGANTELFAKTLGLSQAELVKAFNTDPLDAFQIVLTRINNLAGGDKSKTLGLLKDLKQTGEGVSTVFFQMGENADIFDKNLNNARESINSISSITDEYNTKNNNLAATLEKLSKRFKDLATNDGFLVFIERTANLFLSLAETVGRATQGIGLIIKSFKNGVPFISAFAEVGKSIEKTFGAGISKAFDEGKFRDQNFELASALLDIKKKNKEVEKEIKEASDKIGNAKYSLIFAEGEAKKKQLAEVIRTQEQVIKNAKSKIIDEKAFAKNFIANVAFAPDNEKDLINDQKKKSKDLTDSERIEIEKRISDQKKENEERKRIYKEAIDLKADFNKRMQGLRIDEIDNEFDQRIARVKESTAEEIKQVQEKYKALGSLTNNLVNGLKEAEVKEITKINDERAKTIEEAKNELLKLQDEINQIVKETAASGVQDQIDNLSFNLAQDERTIKIKYDTQIEDLQSQLSKGLISQQQFSDRSEDIEKERLNELISANTKYQKEADLLYKAIANAQKDINKVKYDGILLDIESERLAKVRAAIANQEKNGTSLSDSAAQIKAINDEARVKELQAKQKFNSENQKIDNEYILNTQKVVDTIKGLFESLSGITLNATTSASDEQKEGLRRLKEAAIAIAQETSDALFEIRNNQANKEYENLSNNLEKERQARLKLVKGNTADEERINREFDAKKKKLEQDAFKRQKDLAVQQALINGALAATAVFAVPDFTFGIKSAIQLAIIIANTAAQIATIKSRSFAEGGFGNKFIRKSGEGGYTGGSAAPPDHTGKRPVGYALFHANEYTSPEEQVGANKDLFDALEMDRKKKTWSGSHSEVNKLLRKKAFEALMYQEKTPNIFRQKIDIPIPQLYTVSYFNKNTNSTKVEFTEDMIERLADKIATKAEAAIEKGVGKGYKRAVKDLTIDETRKTLQELKRAI